MKSDTDHYYLVILHKKKQDIIIYSNIAQKTTYIMSIFIKITMILLMIINGLFMLHSIKKWFEEYNEIWAILIIINSCFFVFGIYYFIAKPRIFDTIKTNKTSLNKFSKSPTSKGKIIIIFIALFILLMIWLSMNMSSILWYYEYYSMVHLEQLVLTQIFDSGTQKLSFRDICTISITNNNYENFALSQITLYDFCKLQMGNNPISSDLPDVVNNPVPSDELFVNRPLSVNNSHLMNILNYLIFQPIISNNFAIFARDISELTSMNMPNMSQLKMIRYKIYNYVLTELMLKLQLYGYDSSFYQKTFLQQQNILIALEKKIVQNSYKNAQNKPNKQQVNQAEMTAFIKQSLPASYFAEWQYNNFYDDPKAAYNFMETLNGLAVFQGQNGGSYNYNYYKYNAILNQNEP